ncbi:MAG: acetolactate synthase large subunit [bacterium]|nr:acetolactate synthase large subunit [bacterium]
MKASDLFVKALENEDVEYIFGIPGEENLDFLQSLINSRIKLILTRHEQGAAFMAATYGRLTGKPGVCLSTLGPGATNFVTAAAYAQLGGMPLLMITGQKPIKTSKQGRFQIIDVVGMMKPLTKYTHQIVNGNTIANNVREAFRKATEERPGAVHLELPEDVAAEESPDRVFQKSYVRRPNADKKCLDAAIEMIHLARRPLLLIGASANRNTTSQALTDFVDKSGIPFFNTQMGKGVIDERHELFLGTAALSDHDYLHNAIDAADLIINVGHDVIEKPPFFMEEDGCNVIHVNHFSAEVDPVYFPQVEVVGDIANSVQYLADNVAKQSHWEIDKFLGFKEDIESHITKYFEDKRFPLLPQRIVNEIRKLMPDDGIITLDNGVYKIWFARNYKAYQPNTLLLDNALATMGAGLPSAMGAKITYPNRKVVAICGDGGFMMNSQEMETAVRLKLDIVVIILNDSAYGMIKWKQEGEGFDNFGLDFNNPDFVKYAESYGAHGYRITDCDDFTTTLEKCLNTQGVHLMDVPVDYSLNHQILIKGLAEQSKK